MLFVVVVVGVLAGLIYCLAHLEFQLGAPHVEGVFHGYRGREVDLLALLVFEADNLGEELESSLPLFLQRVMNGFGIYGDIRLFVLLEGQLGCKGFGAER